MADVKTCHNVIQDRFVNITLILTGTAARVALSRKEIFNNLCLKTEI